ncbi:hypothetical protein KJ359_002842 [Pestalotiopsis sp. 9143b]|nr:hypothetical protein KJ359_002842 [Pestalotiopsis sp. 9143b]
MQLRSVLMLLLIRYWDWTLDSQDPTSSPIWSSSDGFGGDGQKHAPVTVKNGSCIESGPFVNYTVQWSNLESDPHCLSRGFGRDKSPARFSGAAFAPHVIDALFQHQDLATFSMELEETSHDAIPNGIGGDFALFTAPSGKY